MALGLAARLAAAGDPVFQGRVAEAIAEAAVAIASEGGAVPGHAIRAAYAAACLNDPPLSIVWTAGQAPFATARSTRVAAFALALVTQGLDATSTDAQISAGVSAIWNALAGA